MLVNFAHDWCPVQDYARFLMRVTLIMCASGGHSFFAK